MRIYKALKDIAKKIMPNAAEKRIEPLTLIRAARHTG